nr:MAG TPA: TraM binding protein, dimer, bacterial.3A [Bacteriophage sp.]
MDKMKIEKKLIDELKEIESVGYDEVSVSVVRDMLKRMGVRVRTDAMVLGDDLRVLLKSMSKRVMERYENSLKGIDSRRENKKR